MSVSSNLLVGDGIIDEFFMLNSQLRQSTIDGACGRLDLDWSAYSPWLCNFPVSDIKPSDELLTGPSSGKGGLVNDQKYLADASAFMSTQPEMFENGLPGTYLDWLPDTATTERADRLFIEGRDLMADASPLLGKMYESLVDFVLPLPGERSRGYSLPTARGLIARSFPPRATKYEVAIDLAHEVGHQALFVWQSADPILVSHPFQPVYSEIRQAFRPAIQSYHAAVALAYMHYFVKSMPDDEGCKEAGARRGRSYRGTLSLSLSMAIHSLRHNCQFTDLGETLMQEMEALVD